MKNLFDNYTSAFNHSDSTAIADNYVIPCAINDSDGKQVYTSYEYLKEKFTVNMESLKTLGYQSAKYKIIKTMPMGEGATAVDISWRVYTTASNIEFKCLYICHLTDLGWKIFSANVYLD